SGGNSYSRPTGESPRPGRTRPVRLSFPPVRVVQLGNGQLPPARAAAMRDRPVTDLFLVSWLLLFLELACIRWFPAHVLFLTFFTNTVLLACFLGMSVGCLAAKHRRNYLKWTPLLLSIALAAAYLVESASSTFERVLDVGHQAAPQ